MAEGVAAARFLPWREGSVRVGDVDIGFDVVGEEGATRTLLLIMGLNIQCIFWPDDFVASFVSSGYRVVRFDNRDIGRSSSVDRGVKVPITRDFLLSRVNAPLRSNYTLWDMVEDTRGLLDHLQVGEVDVVGISMGGIIGQMLAARYPQRVRTLSLLMSHTNHRIWGAPHPKVLLSMGPPPRGATREEVIERNVRGFQVLGSPAYPRSAEELRFAFSLAYDRDHRPEGLERQTHALFATPCIDPLLGDIRCPTTVAHGLSDLLVLPINSRRIAARIRGAKLTMFPGMGHDFPPPLLPKWAELVHENLALIPR